LFWTPVENTIPTPTLGQPQVPQMHRMRVPSTRRYGAVMRWSSGEDGMLEAFFSTVAVDITPTRIVGQTPAPVMRLLAERITRRSGLTMKWSSGAAMTKMEVYSTQVGDMLLALTAG
jgi:hypothetical protein